MGARMENISSLLVMVVFGLGAAVGGLLVSLQRQCVMERIRHEFGETLATMTQKQAGYYRPVEAAGAIRSIQPSQPWAAAEMFDEVEEEPESWEHVLLPANADPSRTHVGA